MNQSFIANPSDSVFGLRPVPSQEWQEDFDRLIRDPYVATKYDRKRRLHDKMTYVDQLAAEIKTGGGRVLDLGPGPGEFLEVALCYGCQVLGIDSAIGHSEMGDEYLQLSRLMTIRQHVPVWYVGFDRLLAQPRLPFSDRSFTFINSQGSIEQVFKDHLVGPRHRETRKARLQSWTMSNEMSTAFERLFLEAHRILVSNGVLLIYGNGASNVEAYDRFMRDTTARMNLFDLTLCRDWRLHKLVKKCDAQ